MNVHKVVCRFLFLLVWFSNCFSAFGQGTQPQLVSVRKIWDKAPHNAFTDLVRWQGRFYCAFREGKGHAGDIGKLRIISSAEGQRWETSGLLKMEGVDLRDAALSVTPDQKLSLIHI